MARTIQQLYFACCEYQDESDEMQCLNCKKLAGGE